MPRSKWSFVMLAIAAAACGSVHQNPGETGGTYAETGGTLAETGGTPAGAGAGAGAGGSGQGGTDSTGCNRTEPIDHRPTAEVCDSTRPPYITEVPDAGVTSSANECLADEQCTGGVNGRCQDFRNVLRCTYDACTQDSECSRGGPCGCEREFWSDANACLIGNCQTDADCGANGFCSPTLGDCGNYAGVIGYYCHTCEDECVNDSDCAIGDCRYSPEVEHWVCSTLSCVG